MRKWPLFFCFFFFSCTPKPQFENYIDAAGRFELLLPKGIVNIGDKQDYLFYAIQNSPEALFTIREEKELGVLRLRGGSIIENLKESWERRYPDRYPGFQKEKYEELNLSVDKAYLYEFTYLGNDQKTRMQQLFAIILRGDHAYYLTGQSKKEDFDKVRQNFLDMIKNFKILKND